MKAITWASQTDDENFAEHGLSFYTATKSLAVTPGHRAATDVLYRIFDPAGSALRCFRCHATGPVRLLEDFKVEPSEPGVRCESCHGPGRAHAESGGTGAIQNPKRLGAAQVSRLCGSCHRQASDLDDDRDWSNAWNVRHQPTYLHRAACFRNSGTLSCVTCHDPHQPLKTAAASYNAQCASCHAKPAHRTPVAGGSCVTCHMPQVTVTANLKFTNHWIGIYDGQDKHLIPSRRVVKELRPAPAEEGSADGLVLAADISTLAPVFEQAAAMRERRAGKDSAKTAGAWTDWGLFLLQTGQAVEAEAPLRRAVDTYARLSDPRGATAAEGLGQALEAQEKPAVAMEWYRQAAGGDSEVAARALSKLAELDPAHAVDYLKRAVAEQEKASGRQSLRTAVLLHQYALELRAAKRDAEAEPVLRRALAIQQSTGADPRVTIGVLNTLGNLLQGKQQLEEGEKLVRSAMALSEQKFGPESPQLAASCVYLADILWSKKELRGAGLLYRRAVTIDASLYGPEAPETAANIANLGMLSKAAGQAAAGETLLRQALAITKRRSGLIAKRPNSCGDKSLRRRGRDRVAPEKHRPAAEATNPPVHPLAPADHLGPLL